MAPTTRAGRAQRPSASIPLSVTFTYSRTGGEIARLFRGMAHTDGFSDDRTLKEKVFLNEAPNKRFQQPGARKAMCAGQTIQFRQIGFGEPN